MSRFFSRLKRKIRNVEKNVKQLENILEDDNIAQKLKELGFTDNHNGFYYLRDAVNSLKETPYIISYYNFLYICQEVAEKNNISKMEVYDNLFALFHDLPDEDRKEIIKNTMLHILEILFLNLQKLHRYQNRKLN